MSTLVPRATNRSTGVVVPIPQTDCGIANGASRDSAYGSPSCPGRYIVEVPDVAEGIGHVDAGPIWAGPPLDALNCLGARMSLDQLEYVTPPNGPAAWVKGRFNRRLKGNWVPCGAFPHICSCSSVSCVANPAAGGVCQFVPDVGNQADTDFFVHTGSPYVGPYRYLLSATLNGVKQKVGMDVRGSCIVD